MTIDSHDTFMLLIVPVTIGFITLMEVLFFNEHHCAGAYLSSHKSVSLLSVEMELFHNTTSWDSVKHLALAGENLMNIIGHLLIILWSLTGIFIWIYSVVKEKIAEVSTVKKEDPIEETPAYQFYACFFHQKFLTKKYYTPIISLHQDKTFELVFQNGGKSLRLVMHMTYLQSEKKIPTRYGYEDTKTSPIGFIEGDLMDDEFLNEVCDCLEKTFAPV